MSLLKKFFAYKAIILIFFILPLGVMGGRTYYIYQKSGSFARYHDSINYIIQHKSTFVALYTIKPYIEKISILFSGKQTKKTTAEKLADWVEARIMYAIMHHEKIESVSDLPCLERSVIKALDGSSYLNKLYQDALYYLTRAKPVPKK